jgi:AcrR family transcriptional regulator
MNVQLEDNCTPECSKHGIKAHQTKLKLIDAALSLFAAQGYEKTTIKEIAKEAGVSLGLLYNYFPSKQELLKQIIVNETFVSRVPQYLKENEDKSVKINILAIANEFYRFIIANEKIMRLLTFESFINPEVAALFECYIHEEKSVLINYLKAKIEAGELRQHDVEETIYILFHTIKSMIEHKLSIEDPYRSIESLVDILMNGIAK